MLPFLMVSDMPWRWEPLMTHRTHSVGWNHQHLLSLHLFQLLRPKPHPLLRAVQKASWACAMAMAPAEHWQVPPGNGEWPRRPSWASHPMLRRVDQMGDCTNIWKPTICRYFSLANHGFWWILEICFDWNHFVVEGAWKSMKVIVKWSSTSLKPQNWFMMLEAFGLEFPRRSCEIAKCQPASHQCV